MARDLYQSITDAIVAQLEAGVRPWAKPWRNIEAGGNFLPLRHNGQPYRGVNVIVLWSATAAFGHASPYWLSFKQAISYGGAVRKGEHGQMVVYASTFRKTKEVDGEEVEESIPFLKAYHVFNASQCDGLPDRFYGKVELPPEQGRIERADHFFRNVGSTVRHGGNRAYYSPSSDHIAMPPLQAFLEPHHYYSTLAHEHIHWTGHKSRLARDFSGRFGNPAYAAEELVAELGAAFTMGALGLESTPREDHASYLASWIKALRDDKRAIFTAAGKAQAAADYLQRAAGWNPAPQEMPQAA